MEVVEETVAAMELVMINKYRPCLDVSGQGFFAKYLGMRGGNGR